MLDTVLLPSFEVEFIVESRPLTRKLHDAGLAITAADLRRTDTYLKADLSPNTCIIVEDSGRKTLRRVLEAIRDAGGTLIYVLAPKTWEPSGAVVVSHGTDQPFPPSVSAPITIPSTVNATDTTPTSSLAEAVIVTVPATVAPAAGADRPTVGG
jgi:hypothetical protein